MKAAMGLAVGTICRTAKWAIVGWELKEVEGKILHRRTETAYKAKGKLLPTSLPNQTKSIPKAYELI